VIIAASPSSQSFCLFLGQSYEAVIPLHPNLSLLSRISRSRPVGVDAGYDAFMAAVGSRLRLQMAGTAALVFATFLLEKGQV
jgi:hypothetical protein